MVQINFVLKLRESSGLVLKTHVALYASLAALFNSDFGVSPKQHLRTRSKFRHNAALQTQNSAQMPIFFLCCTIMTVYSVHAIFFTSQRFSLFPAYLYLKGDGTLPGNLHSTHTSVPLPP